MSVRCVVLVGLTLVCVAGLTGTTEATAACPNETLRSDVRSTQLPECRAYELVSPVDTADSGVLDFFGAAPNGEASEFASPGGFAGTHSNYGFNLYIARRDSEKGWSTSWVGIPATLGGVNFGQTTSFDLTKQLVRVKFLTSDRAGSSGLFLSENLVVAPAFSFAELSEYQNIPFIHTGNEGLNTPSDESPDFARVFIPSNLSRGLWEPKLYEISGIGGPAEKLELVGIAEGKSINAVVGRGNGRGGSIFHAVSNDGLEVFFTKYEREEATGPSYVRVNGKETLPLNGLFQGASEDGAKVFVKTTGGALSMDVIDSAPGHKTVVETVPIAPAEQSNSYLRSSDDGSHLYFLSTGVLAGNENDKEKAEAGKPNLYVYDTDTATKEPVFIAQAEPGGNISEGEIEAQVNGCPSRELGETEEPGCEGGRFFVFTSEAKLTHDTGDGRQVFEYDAQTGRLTRVSVGEGRYDENGNGGSGDATIAAPEFGAPGIEGQEELFEDGTRAVSDDGSTVVFTTARPLSPRALNGQPDIYEWHDGQVGLISTGHSPTADEQAAITPSGRDIFFTSTEGILPQDTDGLKSLYDARIGGGFKAPPVPEGGCNGDSCQGPPSVPELLGPPASATFSGLGNVKPSVPTTVPKPKPKQCRRGYVKRRGRCVKARKKHAGAKTGKRGG